VYRRGKITGSGERGAGSGVRGGVDADASMIIYGGIEVNENFKSKGNFPVD
jgi:hypothetical protein